MGGRCRSRSADPARRASFSIDWAMTKPAQEEGCSSPRPEASHRRSAQTSRSHGGKPGGASQPAWLSRIDRRSASARTSSRRVWRPTTDHGNVSRPGIFTRGSGRATILSGYGAFLWPRVRRTPSARCICPRFGYRRIGAAAPHQRRVPLWCDRPCGRGVAAVYSRRPGRGEGDIPDGDDRRSPAQRSCGEVERRKEAHRCSS